MVPTMSTDHFSSPTMNDESASVIIARWYFVVKNKLVY